MSQDFKPVINLMLFIMVVLWVFSTCAGCVSLGDSPAKQQKSNTSPNMAPVVNTSIPVSQLDLDQDGTISAQEQLVLKQDNQSAIAAFVVIIALVLTTSILSAWASARWAPKAHPKPPTTTRFKPGRRQEEPAAPGKRTGGAPAARSTKHK